MKKGTGRIVIFCGRFVVKFCRIRSLLSIPKSFWRAIYKGEWKTLPVSVRYKWHWFARGIRQNRTEYNCWKVTRAPFLVPIRIGFGIVNVQERERGEEPTWDEMREVYRAIGEKTKYQIYCIDPHCLNPKNFLKNERGYRIVDYGDGSSEDLTFPQFIIRWQNEIKSVFCH